MSTARRHFLDGLVAIDPIASSPLPSVFDATLDSMPEPSRPTPGVAIEIRPGYAWWAARDIQTRLLRQSRNQGM